METATGSALQKQQKHGQSNIVELIYHAKDRLRVRDESRESISETLLYCQALLGIKGANLPDEGERMVIGDYVRKADFNYSLLDIKNAFTLYVGGKLDYHESHFQTFSVLFIEKVLQSYRRYVVSLPNHQKSIPETTLPKSEQEKIIKDGTLVCFDNYKANKILLDFGNVIYDYLDKCGIINLTHEVKVEIYKQAKESLILEGTSKRDAGIRGFEFSKYINEIANNTHDVVVVRAKKIALKRFFDTLIEMDMNLKDCYNES